MIEVHERTSCRSLAVRAVTRGFVRPTLGFFPVRGPMAPFKAAVDLGAGLLPRLSTTSFEHVSGDGWTAELVTTRPFDPAEGALIYFHGGAFIFCGLATHRRIVERLAERTGLPVLSVAYRQLPGPLRRDQRRRLRRGAELDDGAGRRPEPDRARRRLGGRPPRVLGGPRGHRPGGRPRRHRRALARGWTSTTASGAGTATPGATTSSRRTASAGWPATSPGGAGSTPSTRRSTATSPGSRPR